MKLARSFASHSAKPRRPGFVRRLLRSDRGSAAIEFVIIVPLMLLVLTGFAETYCYLRAVSVLEHTAFTLADSLGQLPQVIDNNGTGNASNLGSLYSAATLLASPNDLQASGGVIITSICDGSPSACVQPPSSPSLAGGTPVIHWQRSAPWNGGAFVSKVTSGAPTPSGWPFRVGDSAIVVEVFYKFNPFAMTAAFWPDAPGTQTIYQRVYVRSRTGYPLDLIS
jgi:hypothetical protein